ncbi:hypothetical protein KY316_00520, partial [Candidatus Woesearchaeota archaeon]|nr:hypothetical protein [Candidatus Woesearchaeota archaeon]
NNGVPNIRRARSLNNKIESLIARVWKLRPHDRFDALVKKDYADSLFRQSEFVKFFFFKNYNKTYGVRLFVEYMFCPEQFWENPGDHPKKEAEKAQHSAVKFLEDSLRRINYHAITKRENLMHEIEMRALETDYERVKLRIREELPKIRKLIRDYNLEMGFITKEQYDALEILEKKKEVEERVNAARALLGGLSDTVMSIIMNDVRKENSALFKKADDIKMTEELELMLYDLDFVQTEEYCGSFDGAIRQIEVTSCDMLPYKDKKTGKIRFYSADLYNTCGHENHHMLQHFLSRFMPPGLNCNFEQMSVTARTVEEGVALYLEDECFRDYLDDKRQSLGLSKKDIERIQSVDVYLADKLVKIGHALYNREKDVEDTDFEVHKRLAEQSRNYAFADDNYMTDESFAEVFHHLFYIFGHKVVSETMQEFERRLAVKLGSKRKVPYWIARNQPIIMQGLMTGSWGWTTHREFFLNHYMRKAMKYCS